MAAAPDAPTYFDIMAECEAMADEILDYPGGKSRFPGGIRDALAFPHGIVGNPSVDDLLPFAVAKKKFLTNLLARLKGPVVGQAPPILAAAAVSATPPLPTAALPQPSAPTTAWPAQEYFKTQSAATPYPRFPTALQNARSIKSTDGKERTSPEFFWKSCFEEIVYKREPLGNASLIQCFRERCEALSLPATYGHAQWLKRHSDLLLVLYKAAGVLVTTDKKQAMKILSTTWRKRGNEILEQLATWFQQRLGVPAAVPLPSVVDSILSSIQDWPKQDNATDLHCFCHMIMSEHRFEAEYAKVRGGTAADLAAEHQNLEAEKQKKSRQGKPKGETGAAGPCRGNHTSRPRSLHHRGWLFHE